MSKPFCIRLCLFHLRSPSLFFFCTDLFFLSIPLPSLSPPLVVSLGPCFHLPSSSTFSLTCSLSFSPAHSLTYSFPLFFLAHVIPFPYFPHPSIFFFFLMLSFLISILENFQTLHMNWALPYKCVCIYTEAHTLRDFGSLKGPREILLKRNKFRADS